MTEFAREARLNARNLFGATAGLAFGVGFYTPVSSMFLRALEREFDWSKTATAASLGAIPLVALCLPLVGRFLDRAGVRRPAAASALALAASLWALSLMNGSLALFYIAFLAMNIAGCATGPIAYTRTIAASFHASRGTALAIALAGVSISSMLLPPILAGVIEAHGWRGGYRLLAVLALLGSVSTFWLIRDPAPRQAGRPEAAGMSLGATLGSLAFWILGGAILLISTASFGFVAHLQSIAEERGLAAEIAPRLISVLSLAVFVSRLATGWLLDRLQPEKVAATGLLLSAAGLVLWYFAADSLPLAFVAVLLLGVSIGAELDFLSYFCAHLFGLRHYGQIYGCLSVFFSLGIAVGAILFGRLHDVSGRYDSAVTLSVALLVAASAAFLVLRVARRRIAAPVLASSLART